MHRHDLDYRPIYNFVFMLKGIFELSLIMMNTMYMKYLTRLQHTYSQACLLLSYWALNVVINIVDERDIILPIVSDDRR